MFLITAVYTEPDKYKQFFCVDGTSMGNLQIRLKQQAADRKYIFLCKESPVLRQIIDKNNPKNGLQKRIIKEHERNSRRILKRKSCPLPQ